MQASSRSIKRASSNTCFEISVFVYVCPPPNSYYFVCFCIVWYQISICPYCIPTFCLDLLSYAWKTKFMHSYFALFHIQLLVSKWLSSLQKYAHLPFKVYFLFTFPHGVFNDLIGPAYSAFSSKFSVYFTTHWIANRGQTRVDNRSLQFGRCSAELPLGAIFARRSQLPRVLMQQDVVIQRS